MIAQYAVSLIEKGETIYLDAGTTSLLMLDFITPDMQLNITNGVNQAIVAAKGLNIQLQGHLRVIPKQLLVKALISN